MAGKKRSPKDLVAVRFGAPVEVQAAEQIEGGQAPRFEILAYNGGELRTEAYMKRFGMPVVIDLDGMTYAKSITANMDHDVTQRVGHVTETRNDGRQLVLAGIVSGTSEAANEVIANSKQGYPWQASIEALPTTALEEVKAGQTVTVNGREITGPVLIARQSRLYGVAFLARGADEETTVRIAAAAAQTDEELDVKFEQWIEAMGFDASELTDVQKQSLQSKYDAEIKASAAPVGEPQPEPVKASLAFDLDELKVAYAKHEAAIEAAAFEFQGKVDPAKLAEIKAGALGEGYSLKKKALESEWAPTRFEVEAIKAEYAFRAKCLEVSRPTGPAIHASNRDVSGEVIEAALCSSLGLNVEKQYKPEVLDNAHRNFRRMGLQEMVVLAARDNGYQGRARINQDNLREVLQFAFTPVHASSSFSTVSLSGILSNVANKVLLDGFMEEDQSWRMVADIRSVSDFKQVTSYRMLDDMEYEQLGPNGEIAHGKLGEETFTRSADTYAKMLGITRKQIINDDLGAFDDLRTRLGRGAARKFRRTFWETFLDNSSFFTAGRSNYITGASTALGLDGSGLQSGITKYRKLKSSDKKQVGVGSLGAPTMLVVPPELEFVARRLFESTMVNTGGGASESTVPSANIHAGKYQPVVVNELSDSDYTGNSSTAWYLFGSILKPIAVSFLNGVETPTIESSDADFNTLGIMFRGYHDFGVDQAEWLSGIKSKGAA